MQKRIRERAVQLGNYMVSTRKTVRQIAKDFGVSRSTVHNDLTKNLPLIDKDLALEVEIVLSYHTQVRHLRGGEATRQKHLAS